MQPQFEFIDASDFTFAQYRDVGVIVQDFALPWLFVWTIGAPAKRYFA